MHQLKKIGAIGGAISLALCWPLAVGQIGQNVITDGINNFDNASVKAEIVSYDRGYLSSVVKTRYTLTDEALAEQLQADGLPTDWIVLSNIDHGLLSLSAVSVLENVPQLPLTLNTVTQLNGNTDFSLELAAWHQEFSGEDGAAISIAPSNLTGHATVLGNVNYQLDIPSIEIDFNSGEKLIMTSLTGQGDGKQLNGYWLGDQVAKLDSIRLTEGESTTLLDINQAQYEFNSALDDMTSRLDSHHVFTINNATMDEDTLSNFKLDVSLGDIDSESFSQLLSLYQNNPQLTETEIQKAIPYVETLFSKGFNLTMNKMALTLGKGEFESAWNVTIPEGTDNVAADPTKILPALTGKLDTYFSDELVEEYPFIKQGIDEAVIMEFVQDTDTGYKINADLKDGKLVFANGQQVPLFALLMPLMLQP